MNARKALVALLLEETSGPGVQMFRHNPTLPQSSRDGIALSVAMPTTHNTRLADVVETGLSCTQLTSLCADCAIVCHLYNTVTCSTGHLAHGMCL